jgi:hypothetical protein
MRVAAGAVASFIIAFCGPAFGQAWVEFRPAGAGFRIEVPSEPQIKKEAIKTDAGPVPTTIAVAELGTTMAFVVMYSQYTEKQLAGRSSDQVLDGARDGSVKTRSLRNEQRLTMSGHPARRLIIDADNGMVFMSQIVLVGPQLIQAIFAGSAKGAENGAEAKRFVESFAIVDR